MGSSDNVNQAMDTLVHGNSLFNNMGNIHSVHQGISRSCSNSNNYGDINHNKRNTFTAPDTAVYMVYGNSVFSNQGFLI